MLKFKHFAFCKMKTQRNCFIEKFDVDVFHLKELCLNERRPR